MDPFMQAAIEEARKGLAKGGIPIGSVLVIDGQVVGRGHNQRVQKGSAILHAEMDCLENAGRLTAKAYQRAVLLIGQAGGRPDRNERGHSQEIHQRKPWRW